MPQSAALAPSIFRAYDVRGLYGSQLSAETMHSIGRAIAVMTLDAGNTQLIVGRDGRTHGEELKGAFAQGVLSGGVDVFDIGVVPSPVVYWAATHDCPYGQGSGVVITASHNPPQYNGIKVVLGGKTLAGDEIQKIYRTARRNHAPAAVSGKLQSCEIEELYCQTLLAKFAPFKEDFCIAIDPANGVSGPLATQVIHALGARLCSINTQIDGTFPAHPADPTEIGNMIQLKTLVADQSADIGLGFDGDGDRVGCIDASGRFVSADIVLLWLAHQRAGEGSSKYVVFDVKATSLLERMLPEIGLKPFMVRTGHSFIKETIAEYQPWIAGEMSGHCFFPENWYPFDDALYAGLVIAQTQQNCATRLEDFVAGLPNLYLSPELKIALPQNTGGKDVVAKVRGHFAADKVSLLDGMRYQDERGFIALRPSNTSPVLTVRIEGYDQDCYGQLRDMLHYAFVREAPELDSTPLTKPPRALHEI